MDALVQISRVLLLRQHPPAMARLRRSLEETQRHLLASGVAFPRDLRLVRNEEGLPLPGFGHAEAGGLLRRALPARGTLEQSLVSAIETAPAPIRFLERTRIAIIYSVISVFILLLFGIPSCLIQQSGHRGVLHVPEDHRGRNRLQDGELQPGHRAVRATRAIQRGRQPEEQLPAKHRPDVFQQEGLRAGQQALRRGGRLPAQRTPRCG